MSPTPITVTTTLSSIPIFLFPIFNCDKTIITEKTTLRGEVHATVNVDRIDVEGVQVFWEVGVFQRGEERGEWDDGVIWGRYEGVVVDFGRELERGKYM